MSKNCLVGFLGRVCPAWWVHCILVYVSAFLTNCRLS